MRWTPDALVSLPVLLSLSQMYAGNLLDEYFKAPRIFLKGAWVDTAVCMWHSLGAT
jgi:hypothetical protein